MSRESRETRLAERSLVIMHTAREIYIILTYYRLLFSVRKSFRTRDKKVSKERERETPGEETRVMRGGGREAGGGGRGMRGGRGAMGVGRGRVGDGNEVGFSWQGQPLSGCRFTCRKL